MYYLKAHDNTSVNIFFFFTFQILSVCFLEVRYLILQRFDFLVKFHNLCRYKKAKQTSFSIQVHFDDSVFFFFSQIETEQKSYTN